MILFLTASYCGADTASEPSVKLNEISMTDFSDTVKKNAQIKVLDVRTPQEYMEGHVPGAKLFPLQDLQSQGASAVEKIPFTKEDTVYVICRSGGRSKVATKILNQLGYSNAINVQGGTAGFISMQNKVEK